MHHHHDRHHGPATPPPAFHERSRARDFIPPGALTSIRPIPSSRGGSRPLPPLPPSVYATPTVPPYSLVKPAATERSRR